MAEAKQPGCLGDYLLPNAVSAKEYNRDREHFGGVPVSKRIGVGQSCFAPTRRCRSMPQWISIGETRPKRSDNWQMPTMPLMR